ncbi:hypothetical protein ABIB75_005844 [Bradyrhizobium sp. GM2.2]
MRCKAGRIHMGPNRTTNRSSHGYGTSDRRSWLFSAHLIASAPRARCKSWPASGCQPTRSRSSPASLARPAHLDPRLCRSQRRALSSPNCRMSPPPALQTCRAQARRIVQPASNSTPAPKESPVHDALEVRRKPTLLFEKLCSAKPVSNPNRNRTIPCHSSQRPIVCTLRRLRFRVPVFNLQPRHQA